MKSIAITGTLRAAQTKQELKQLRAEGKVPCVLYGGKDQVHFSAPVLDFRHLVYSPEVYTVDLNIGGSTRKAVMKEIQFHPVTDALLHIDFYELKEDRNVVIEIPVKFTGSAAGVKAGGSLITKYRKLKVSALPKHLPDNITIKIDGLEIGDSVRVRDLKHDGLEFLNGASNVIVAVKTTRNVVETPAETAAAAPAAAAPAAAPAKGAEAAKPAAKK